MIAVTARLRMTSAISAPSPTSPTTSGYRLRQRRAKSRREVVDHDHGFAGIRQLVHHVAADIAAAACNQDGHGCPAVYRKLARFGGRWP